MRFSANMLVVLLCVAAHAASGERDIRLFLNHPACRTFAAENGVILSPAYPGYPPNVQCEVNITAPENCIIRIIFADFQMEKSSGCWSDSLEVWDGPQAPSRDVTQSELVGRYCGNVSPGVVVSTTNVVRLLISTDRSMGGRGFKAAYDFLEMGKK